MGTPASELRGDPDTDVGNERANIKLDKDYNFESATVTDGERQVSWISYPQRTDVLRFMNRGLFFIIFLIGCRSTHNTIEPIALVTANNFNGKIVIFFNQDTCIGDIKHMKVGTFFSLKTTVSSSQNYRLAVDKSKTI